MWLHLVLLLVIQYSEYTYTINNGTMLDTFGLTSDDIAGGDLFVLRYDLKLKDGRSFSAADTGTNVRTTSHRAPLDILHL